MRQFDDHSVINGRDISLAHPHLQTLEGYWQRIRKADEVPARSDLNPHEIEHILPSTFILQRVAPGTARFRVAGQKVHDLLKIDPRGMPFSVLFDQGGHDDLRQIIESVCSDPAISGLQVQSPATLLRPSLDGALLLLPMRDTAGQMTRILGAIVTPENLSHRPRRFTIRDDVMRRHDRLGPFRPELVSLLSVPARSRIRPDAISRPALKLVVNNG